VICRKRQLEIACACSDGNTRFIRQVLKSLGVTKGEKSIARSHIVVGKGGAIEDLQIGISPGQDSVTLPVVEHYQLITSCACRLGHRHVSVGQAIHAKWRRYECNTLRTV
jgi:hypothetical protein